MDSLERALIACHDEVGELEAVAREEVRGLEAKLREAEARNRSLDAQVKLLGARIRLQEAGRPPLSDDAYRTARSPASRVVR